MMLPFFHLRFPGPCIGRLELFMPSQSCFRLAPAGFVWLSLLGVAVTPAQAEPVTMVPAQGSHAIDLEIDSCLEAVDWLPELMLDCAEAAEQKWQAEVERLTDRLASVIGSEARDALEVSDALWQSSRDAELKFIDAYHRQLEEAELGNPQMRGLSVQMYRNEVVKMRVERLQSFLAGLERMPVPHQP